MGDQQHSPKEVTNDSLPVVARRMGCTDPFVGNPFPQDHRESVRAIYFLSVSTVALTESTHP